MKYLLFSTLFLSLSVMAQTGQATGTATAPGTFLGGEFSGSAVTGPTAPGTSTAPSNGASPGFAPNNGTTVPGNFANPGRGFNDVTPDTTTTNTIPSSGFGSMNTADIAAGRNQNPTSDTPTTVSPSVINTSPNPTPDMNASGTFNDTLSTGQTAPTRNTFDQGPFQTGSSDPVEKQSQEQRP